MPPFCHIHITLCEEAGKHISSRTYIVAVSLIFSYYNILGYHCAFIIVGGLKKYKTFRQIAMMVQQPVFALSMAVIATLVVQSTMSYPLAPVSLVSLHPPPKTYGNGGLDHLPITKNLQKETEGVMTYLVSKQRHFPYLALVYQCIQILKIIIYYLGSLTVE